MKNKADTESAPFSLRMLGFGFWQAWWMLVLCTPIVLPVNVNVLGVRPSVWALLLTSLGFALIAFLSRTRGSFIGRTRSLLFCSLGTALCILLRPALDINSVAVVFAIALGCSAFGNALLLILWGELWATLATDRVIQYLVTSYAFSFVLFFGVQMLSSLLIDVTTCLLPVISCVVLKSSLAETRRAPSSAEFVADRPLVVRALGAVVIAGLAYGVAQSFFAHVAVPLVPSGRPDMLVAGLGLIVLTVYVLIGRISPHPAVLYRPIVPAISIGLILFGSLPLALSYGGNGLIIVGGYCLDMLVMLVSTDLAFRAKRSVALFFACSILSLRLATIAGLAAVDLAIGSGLLSLPCQQMLPVVAAIVVIIAGTLLFTQSDLQRFYQTQPAPWPGEDMAERCENLAVRYGLTTREAEVFALLASGRNVPYLCKELCIAESTARHHVGSIYRKLGVYDRQSMLDIILQG